MFNDLSTPLTHLASRRSGKPRDLVAPGPTHAQLVEMIALAGGRRITASSRRGAS